MQKRILLCLLAMLLTLSATACGNSANETTANETTANADTTVEENAAETTALEGLAKENFNGRTYTILDANDHTDMHINIHVGELTGDAINDAIYNRDLLVSEKMGVTIAYEQTEPASPGCTQLQNNVMAGDESYQIVIGPVLGAGIANLSTNGVLYNLNEMEDADWTTPWWSALMYDTMQLKGKFLYTTGDIAASVYQAPFCVFYNVDLGIDYGLDVSDLFADVRNGDWTYEKLFTMTEGMNRDLDGNNKYDEEDFAGIMIQTGYDSMNALMTSCGIHMSEIDEKGDLVVNLMNEKTVGTMEMMHHLYDPCFKYSSNTASTHYMFPEGRGLFLIHKVETATAALREMEDDFAILPMPKYDTTQNTYYSLVSGWVDCFIAMPKNLSDPHFNGYVTEALARAAYDIVRPAAFETTLKGKTARDAESVAMLDLIFNTLYCDFNCLHNFGSICTKMADWLVSGEGFASGYASVESAIQSAIEKLMESYSQE